MSTHNKINTSEEHTSPNWLRVIHLRVKERNARECKPVEDIYKSNNHFWEKSNYLDSMRISTKHSLAILSWETSDMVNKGDIENAAANIAKKLQTLHADLRDYHNRDSTSIGVNLSKVIYDQRKLISNQQEEIKIAKQQTADSFNREAKLEEQYQAELKLRVELEQKVNNLQREIVERDQTIQSLTSENTQLTSRIITEKNKSAKEIDEMNKLLTGAK